MRPGSDPRQTRWIALRIGALGLLFAVGFGAVLARAVWIQVIHRQKYAGEVQAQIRREFVLRPRRGVVTDRTGVLLAGSADVGSAFADAKLLLDPKLRPELAVEARITRLARAAGVDARALGRKLRADPESRFLWVKRRLAPEAAAAVRALELPGVGLVPETRRYYPKGALAAQVLGLVGDDGDGLEGVELLEDEVLRGEPSRVPSVRDRRGALILSDAPGTARSEGARVELTLDQALQLVAERALGAAVASSHALSGMAIALDPATGEVLAMASTPSFDPNARRTGEVVRNRTVTDPYEPGSTVKTFTIAGALDRGVLRPLDPIDCGNGTLAIGAHVIHDHRAFGWAGAAKILAVSSNVGAARIGARLGREGLHRVLGAFGFGERTGVDLPGESAGQLQVPRSDIALATQSFGQAMSATALQVTSAMAAIANGGVRMRPTLVRRVVDPATGEVLEAAEPTPLGRAVSAEAAGTVQRWLAGVVEDPQGTGHRARPDGWRVAGKTGTGQKADPVSGGYSHERHFSSFVGFAPADRPRIVIGVFVDEPKGEIYGGEVAAPAFREIAEYAMKMLGVPQEGGAAVAAADPPPDPGNDEEDDGPAPVVVAERHSPRPAGAGVAVPALQGLPARAALKRLEAEDLSGEITGTGRVTGQSPAPGRVVPPGARVRLTLVPPG